MVAYVRPDGRLVLILGGKTHVLQPIQQDGRKITFTNRFLKVTAWVLLDNILEVSLVGLNTDQKFCQVKFPTKEEVLDHIQRAHPHDTQTEEEKNGFEVYGVRANHEELLFYVIQPIA